MLNKLTQKTGAVILAVGATFAGVNAQADEYMVTYSNAELTSSAGVENVHARIIKAAKQYCPTYSQIRSHNDVKLCVDGVVADLVSKVNHPQLTSLHESGSAVSVAETGKPARDRG